MPFEKYSRARSYSASLCRSGFCAWGCLAAAAPRRGERRKNEARCSKPDPKASELAEPRCVPECATPTVNPRAQRRGSHSPRRARPWCPGARRGAQRLDVGNLDALPEMRMYLARAGGDVRLTASTSSPTRVDSSTGETDISSPRSSRGAGHASLSSALMTLNWMPRSIMISIWSSASRRRRTSCSTTRTAMGGCLSRSERNVVAIEREHDAVGDRHRRGARARALEQRALAEQIPGLEDDEAALDAADVLEQAHAPLLQEERLASRARPRGTACRPRRSGARNATEPRALGLSQLDLVVAHPLARQVTPTCPSSTGSRPRAARRASPP